MSESTLIQQAQAAYQETLEEREKARQQRRRSNEKEALEAFREYFGTEPDDISSTLVTIGDIKLNYRHVADGICVREFRLVHPCPDCGEPLKGYRRINNLSDLGEALAEESEPVYRHHHCSQSEGQALPATLEERAVDALERIADHLEAIAEFQQY